MPPLTRPNMSMNSFPTAVRFFPRSILLAGRALFAGLCLQFSVSNSPAASVATYGRFEQSFTSATDYANPVQEASLTVTVTSPKGDAVKIPGFWDGAKTWRVRFIPTQPGSWKFETTCSDTKNAGLHQQSGSFTAGPPAGSNRFAQHGPVEVAPDGRFFQHADGTPFFWLGDTAWNGPLLSSTAEWDQYLKEIGSASCREG